MARLPVYAQRPHQEHRRADAAHLDVERRQPCRERGVLRRDHFEIGNDAATITIVGLIQGPLRGGHGGRLAGVTARPASIRSGATRISASSGWCSALRARMRASVRAMNQAYARDVVQTGPAVRTDSLVERRGFELPVLFALRMFREGL